MNNKYTFLLPAYKIEYFQEALESILNQTYKDFKLIIQDDCSPFDIKSIVEKYSHDKRVYYYRNEVNIGGKNLVKCWNNLLEKADSEYIILASDDDVYDIHFLEEIDRLTNKYPQVDLLRARVKPILSDGEQWDIDGIYEEYGDSLYYLHQRHLNNFIRCIACYVFKLEELKKIGGFFYFPLAWHSDDATALLMSKNGIVNTKLLLFSFRHSNINISSRNIDRKDAFQKAIATINYDKFFYNYISELSLMYPESILKNNIINKVLYIHDSFVFSMFRNFSKYCSIKQFIYLLRKRRKCNKYKEFYRYLFN